MQQGQCGEEWTRVETVNTYMTKKMKLSRRMIWNIETPRQLPISWKLWYAIRSANEKRNVSKMITGTQNKNAKGGKYVGLHIRVSSSVYGTTGQNYIASDRNQPSFLPSMAARDATPRASTAKVSNIQNTVISLDMILPYIAFTRSCIMTSTKIKHL